MHQFGAAEAAVQRWSAQEFYAVPLARAGVAAEHALFIDHSLPNVHAANALGILGHHFIGHHEMLTFLQSTGVLRNEAD